MGSRCIANSGREFVSRPRVLIAHPHVYSSGGGNAVAAWALQALREEFEVTLCTLGPVDIEAVNRNFGTSLCDGDFRVRIAPAFWQGVLRYSPTPGGLLRQCVIMRWAQDLDRENPFDVLLSTQNETDFGRPGVQYVHFPWKYLPRPAIEIRWFHHIPGFLEIYRTSCQRVARASDAGLRRNLSLANSEFVAALIRKTHGVDSKVLYPPVLGGFPPVPWENRVAGVVGLGRMHAIKRWEWAVEILDRVRSEGADLSMTLISNRDEAGYGARIEALAATRPWFRILYDLARDELVREVARHRYGLHTMENEHFGIAPAELLRAGCVTFVHRSGGPMEIVGHRDELMFSNAAEASERICRAVLDKSLEHDLRCFTAAKKEQFSELRFSSELRDVVWASV
jgi:glycosyltransferase involved in cell wall biosynthesis